MINRIGVLIFIGCFIFGATLIFWAMRNSERWLQTPRLQTNWQKGPKFLKIKKIGLSKTVIASRNIHFSCDIKKSYLPLELNNSKQILKEYLSKISGHITDGSKNPELLSFKGREGILNYHDYSLTISDCLFNIETPNSETNGWQPDSLFPSDISSKGGMRVLTLSLLKTNK